jgi:hypothetical protein
MSTVTPNTAAPSSPIDPAWVAQLRSPTPLYFAHSAAADDLPDHVSAGSGIRRWGERVVILQDDVNALALLNLHTRNIEPLLLPAGPDGRRSFGDDRGNKALKLDLEACVVLPHGRFVAFGSGSTAARERIVVVEEAHTAQLVDASQFYARLRANRAFAGSELNIEGAVVTPGGLMLFQRGNGAPMEGRQPVNASGVIDIDHFTRWLRGEAPAPDLTSVRQFDLGSVQGVPFSFTDATTLPDGRVVFIASAEDSPDTYHDGVVVGSRVGVIEDQCVYMADIQDEHGTPSRLKLEGIDFLAQSERDGLEFQVVADMDDPNAAAMLATLMWGPLG